MGFPALPSATAELVVLHLIAQHDPQPNPQLATGRHFRFPQSFLRQLAAVKALRLHILPQRMTGGFASKKAQHGVALFRQPT
jgi:hypothetical protein